MITQTLELFKGLCTLGTSGVRAASLLRDGLQWSDVAQISMLLPSVYADAKAAVEGADQIDDEFLAATDADFTELGRAVAEHLKHVRDSLKSLTS